MMWQVFVYTIIGAVVGSVLARRFWRDSAVADYRKDKDEGLLVGGAGVAALLWLGSGFLWPLTVLYLLIEKRLRRALVSAANKEAN